MSDSHPHRRLRRLERGGRGVVTINLRTSKVVAFWLSPNLLAPVAKGFYVHAATTPAETMEDREQPMNLSDDRVQWQHSVVRDDGRTQLKLERRRRYRFFITADKASAADLRDSHLPWPVYVYRAERRKDATVLAFPVPVAAPHTHDRDAPDDADGAGAARDPSVLGFGATEHESAAGRADRSSIFDVQSMLNHWAEAGLIDGGAMIDTRGPFKQWRFLCPGEAKGATPERPYGKPSRHHAWHYVLPHPKHAGNGKPWTGASLSEAIEKGEAVALTAGQTIMLAGDLFRRPRDMETADRRPQPVNVMQKYTQAWESRRNNWRGYEEAFAFVYMVFDVLLFHDAEKEGRHLVDYLRGVSEGQTDWLKRVPLDKVEAAVDVIQAARGPTRYSEIHFLAQVLGGAGGRGKRTLGWMLDRLPWLAKARPEATLRNGGLDSQEMGLLKSGKGFNGEFIDLVGSYGRYAELALDNAAHFSEKWVNFRTFQRLHEKALRGVADAVSSKDPAERPIPAQSIWRTAFGCHFLTDGFSSGHLRVPRSKFDRHGGLAAKLMHDIDGYYGLLVWDEFGNTWRGFGDSDLRGWKLDRSQRKVVAKVRQRQITGYLDDTDTNYHRMRSTVATAFKQLLTEAYSKRETKNRVVRAIPGKPFFEKVLDPVGPFAPVTLGVDPRASARTLEWPYVTPNGEPGAGPTVWDDLQMKVKEKIRYLGKHMPRATAVGKDPDRNHPPLFHPDGSIDDSDSYQIIIAAGEDRLTRWARSLIPAYQGFVLRLTWHGFEDFWDDNEEIRLPFDQFYFLTVFSQGIRGLEPYTETKLLEVYRKLDKQLA
ncbi:MAG: hypothetical protein PVF51_11740 [Nitrospirota bacterium]|jgi:hypothetical protein